MRFAAATLMLMLSAAAVLANGGNQRYLGNYLVQLSQAPISPLVGENVSFILAFADLNGNLLEGIKGSINATTGSGEEFFVRFDAPIGAYQFGRVFEKETTYHIEVAFTGPDGAEYSTDFLVQARGAQAPPPHTEPTYLAALFFVGLLAGLLVSKKLKRKQK